LLSLSYVPIIIQENIAVPAWALAVILKTPSVSLRELVGFFFLEGNRIIIG